MSSVSLKQWFSARNNPPTPTRGHLAVTIGGWTVCFAACFWHLASRGQGSRWSSTAQHSPHSPSFIRPRMSPMHRLTRPAFGHHSCPFLPVDPFTLWLTSTVLPCMFKLFHIPTFRGLGFNHLCFGFSLNTGCISALSFSESRTLF